MYIIVSYRTLFFYFTKMNYTDYTNYTDLRLITLKDTESETRQSSVQ